MNIIQQFGYSCEEHVAQYLIELGFSIIARNYKRSFGEIDLIAQKEDLLIFIEVKARKKPLFDMSELISYTKQKKIITVAKSYLAAHNIYDMNCRFDVALVSTNNTTLNLEYISNAFTETDF